MKVGKSTEKSSKSTKVQSKGYKYGKGKKSKSSNIILYRNHNWFQTKIPTQWPVPMLTPTTKSMCGSFSVTFMAAAQTDELTGFIGSLPQFLI